MSEILDRIVKMNHAYIYLILYAACLIPLIFPLGLGIKVGRLETLAYNIIEELPEGSKVLFYSDFRTMTIDKTAPTRVLLEHLFRKNLQVIIVPHFPEVVTQFKAMIPNLPAAKGKVYGKDYIILSLLPDDEANHARFAANIPDTCPEDALYGKPVATYPIMTGIQKVTDVQLGIASEEKGEQYIRQVAGAYKLRSIMVHGIDQIPWHSGLIEAGIIQAAVDGPVAYAGYEKLLGFPGPASQQLDSFSLAVIYVIVLFAIGNINMLLNKNKAKRLNTGSRVQGGNV